MSRWRAESPKFPAVSLCRMYNRTKVTQENPATAADFAVLIGALFAGHIVTIPSHLQVQCVKSSGKPGI